MAYIKSKIELYKRLGDGEGSWDTTPIVVTQFFNKSIKKSMGTKKDTFKFNLMNSYNKYFLSGNTFKKGDRIKIYQIKNKDTYTVDDMLIDGVITGITGQNNTNKVLTIQGASNTEQFLEGLTFVSSTTELSPATILEQSLDFHNRNNKNFQITWKSTNPTTKSDTTAFPTYFVEDFYKPMNLLFEKYSSNEYTKDGSYFYYVNDDNEIIWNKKNTVSEGTLNESECQDVQITDNSDFVINSIVASCGRTPYNKPIRAYYYDYASRAKDGAKWKYMSTTNTIASDLMKAEREKNPSSFDSNGDVFPNSYPYTTIDGTVCSNDGDFEDAIKERAKTNGLERAKSYAQGVNQSRLQVTASIPFTKDYSISQMITCNFPSYNIEGVLLRLTDIQYTDYKTVLTLLQDEEI